MNDTEREQWLINDAELNGLWRSSRQSVRQFLRENRDVITGHIQRKLNKRWSGVTASEEVKRNAEAPERSPKGK